MLIFQELCGILKNFTQFLLIFRGGSRFCIFFVKFERSFPGISQKFNDFGNSDVKIFIFQKNLRTFPDFLQNSIKKLKEVRGGGEKLLTIALGYGGRQEIVDAMKSLLQENQELEIQDLIKSINDEQIRDHLYSPDSPDIDLIIRTSGESRLSGFLLWQSAYSEVVLQDVYWPEFRKIDFLRCLREYVQRDRRFGK